MFGPYDDGNADEPSVPVGSRDPLRLSLDDILGSPAKKPRIGSSSSALLPSTPYTPSAASVASPAAPTVPPATPNAVAPATTVTVRRQFKPKAPSKPAVAASVVAIASASDVPERYRTQQSDTKLVTKLKPDAIAVDSPTRPRMTAGAFAKQELANANEDQLTQVILAIMYKTTLREANPFEEWQRDVHSDPSRFIKSKAKKAATATASASSSTDASRAAITHFVRTGIHDMKQTELRLVWQTAYAHRRRLRPAEHDGSVSYAGFLRQDNPKATPASLVVAADRETASDEAIYASLADAKNGATTVSHTWEGEKDYIRCYYLPSYSTDLKMQHHQLWETLYAKHKSVALLLVKDQFGSVKLCTIGDKKGHCSFLALPLDGSDAIILAIKARHRMVIQLNVRTESSKAEATP